jgi:hypothetical protein
MREDKMMRYQIVAVKFETRGNRRSGITDIRFRSGILPGTYEESLSKVLSRMRNGDQFFTVDPTGKMVNVKPWKDPNSLDEHIQTVADGILIDNLDYLPEF